ncbi:MAG TPA: DUF202 domain-containing protein [Streptomyces sp.]|nr:DUF202 domain-containing protein [Streptomyces sp.]
MSGGPAPAGRDPGLQPERTRLSWRRTTLSATVCGVLAVRTALRDGAMPGRVAVTVLVCVLWAGFWLLARRRVAVLAQGGGPAAMSVRHAAAAALCTAALAVCGAALVL